METSEEMDEADRRAELEGRVQEILESRDAADALREQRLTFGERAADKLAAQAGSWTFIFAFLGALAVWIALNTVAWINHWDTYPFMLLNLVLSILAALQAPVIMMSQNRGKERDHLHDERDYRTNVRQEILMEHLTAEVEEIKQLLWQRTTPPQ